VHVTLLVEAHCAAEVGLCTPLFWLKHIVQQKWVSARNFFG